MSQTTVNDRDPAGENDLPISELSLISLSCQAAHSSYTCQWRGKIKQNKRSHQDT